jgi:hypothetical protein
VARISRTLLACVVFAGTLLAADDFPQASISNKVVKAIIYLPDAQHGYYRGSRFDWSGVVASLEYAGHNYFGVWFPKYDPTLHDAITGPVEEFRTGDAALGFQEAQPGGMFIKIGVGVLRKPDDKPYSFARSYPIVNNGKWVVRPSRDRVEFEQDLRDSSGYGYEYSKTLRLNGDKPELILEHTLKNTGKRVIETDVYNHDFYVIDHQPTGPEFVVKFPFRVEAKSSLKDVATAAESELTFQRELQAPHESIQSELTGFGPSPKDNDIRVENHETGAGVRETGDHPIEKINFWAIRTTLCPEVYTRFRIEPGKKVKWRIRYVFLTEP